MCEGEKRKEMIREAYRLGYEAAKQDMAPVPDNVVDFTVRLQPLGERTSPARR